MLGAIIDDMRRKGLFTLREGRDVSMSRDSSFLGRDVRVNLLKIVTPERTTVKRLEDAIATGSAKERTAKLEIFDYSRHAFLEFFKCVGTGSSWINPEVRVEWDRPGR